MFMQFIDPSGKSLAVASSAVIGWDITKYALKLKLSNTETLVIEVDFNSENHDYKAIADLADRVLNFLLRGTGVRVFDIPPTVIGRFASSNEIATDFLENIRDDIESLGETLEASIGTLSQVVSSRGGDIQQELGFIAQDTGKMG